MKRPSVTIASMHAHEPALWLPQVNERCEICRRAKLWTDELFLLVARKTLEKWEKQLTEVRSVTYAIQKMRFRGFRVKHDLSRLSVYENQRRW